MIIPKPVDFEAAGGEFLLSPQASVFIESGGQSPKGIEARLREALSPATGFPFPVIADRRQATIALAHDGGIPAEGYELRVTAGGVEIRARDEAGWFYGIQTLRQLLPAAIFGNRPAPGEWRIPCGVIRDFPRFAWRGLMLDTARHFFSIADIKRFLDHMALHKLNVFHWHLTDDQGWRLEIRKYPQLTEVGSRRRESPKAGDRNTGDGTPYGGFYTQAEVRELVRYASERQIVIVPEIEMPGHVGALIAAYPELGNRDAPGFQPEVRTRWGVNPNILAPTEEVFQFLEGVLDEVLELFPGEFIHIGGDEAPKEQWRQSPTAQEIRKAVGLEDEEQMQRWFITRIGGFLEARGRRLIGWDEISEAGLPPGAAMMLWRDWKWARQALAAGHSVVMSPASHCYLDYAQGPIESEPEAICGEITLEKACAFEPVPEGMPPEEAARILGVQGNVWTEYIRDRDHLDYMTWPRAAALAEAGWSPQGTRDWVSFSRRITHHVERLKALGIRFRPLDPRDV